MGGGRLQRTARYRTSLHPSSRSLTCWSACCQTWWRNLCRCRPELEIEEGVSSRGGGHESSVGGGADRRQHRASTAVCGGTKAPACPLPRRRPQRLPQPPGGPGRAAWTAVGQGLGRGAHESSGCCPPALHPALGRPRGPPGGSGRLSGAAGRQQGGSRTALGGGGPNKTQKESRCDEFSRACFYGEVHGAGC